MKKRSIICAAAVLLVLPVMSFAQGTNSGATVTAPFLVTPPVIDGAVSDGEWDAAATLEGPWSDHGSTAQADSAFPTTVKVAYSLKGLYILFECVDDEVLAKAGASEYLGSGPTAVEGQGQPFGFGEDTDYLAVYLDPTNYQDDQLNANYFSYSIQAEPAVTATGGSESSSYTYSEAGQSGRFKRLFNPPLTDNDGNVHYWAGGVSWELDGTVIVDGPTDAGYVMEWFIPWGDLDGYYQNWAGEILDGLSDIGQDETDPFYSSNALLHAYFAGEGGSVSYPGFGAVTGMPMPGSTWKVQFSRYSEGMTPQYVNWVGDTGGFVTRPFGNLVFGDAEVTAVRDAILHELSQ
ncbi:MAG: hypothetical protein JXR73_17540 [Candidatus Omnitrophica bacterium]|nr:hypothetical protein [Candidatus Omnitrophota bacterium]